MLVVLQAAFAKAWGRGFSLDNLTLRNVRFVLFDQPATRTATINTFVYAGAASVIALGLALAIAYVVARQLVPLGPRALVRRHGALRDPGHRAGHRFLRRLHDPAARALRHRLDPHPGVHHALSAHRLHQQRRRPPEHQPGDGRRRAHPRQQPAPGAPSHRGPPAQARPGGGVHPGLHPGHAGAVLRHLPLHDRDPGALRAPLRQERRGQLRDPLLHGAHPGRDHRPRGARWASGWWGGTSCCGGRPREQARARPREPPLRRRHRRRDLQPRPGARRVRLAPRPVRLRQDDDAPDDRGLPGAQRGHDRDGRRGHLVARLVAAAREAQHVDDLPELRHLAEHDGGGERGLRPRGAPAARARRSAPRWSASSTWCR